MLKKIFLGFVALIFILFGGLSLLMGYVFNNPEKVFKAFTAMTDSMASKFIEGQPYEEKTEFLLQGMNHIQLTSQRADLKIQTYDGPTMKVIVEGKIPRFEQGPIIIQTTDNDRLHVELHEPLASHWIQFNVNGQETTQESNSQLAATFYVPISFKGQLIVETKSGSVDLRLPEQELYELDLRSTSGKISNNLKQQPAPEVNPQDVGRIKVQTTDGSILADAL